MKDDDLDLLRRLEAPGENLLTTTSRFRRAAVAL